MPCFDLTKPKIIFCSIIFLVFIGACSSPRENTNAQHEKSTGAYAQHEKITGAKVQYLANTGLLVSHGDTKVLFDPLFNNGFDTYHLVPDSVRTDLLSGHPPFDGVDAIFISHAHGDHFDSADINRYFGSQTNVVLVAPQQAIESLRNAPGWSAEFLSRIKPVALELGEAPMILSVGNIEISIVRVPHAGWPNRMLDVQNMVYRVDLGEGVVMHMGDADPNHQHFSPYEDHWNALKTNVAFPPYWFFSSRDGNGILDETLNIDHAIGVHVPIRVPSDLKSTGADYFSKPGEIREIHTH